MAHNLSSEDPYNEVLPIHAGYFDLYPHRDLDERRRGRRLKETLGSWERSSSGSRSATSRIANELGKAIVSGQFPANSLLPKEAGLIATYGASRVVLREAMKLLIGKGLLRSKARLGTTVLPREWWSLFDSDVLVWCAQTGLDDAFISHLTEIRSILEPEAAAFAARRRSAKDLANLYDWLGKMSSTHIGEEEFLAAGISFHLAVASAAGNPFFKSARTVIEVALVANRTTRSPTSALLSGYIARHRAVVDAIAAGDSDAARKAMQVILRSRLA